MRELIEERRPDLPLTVEDFEEKSPQTTTHCKVLWEILQLELQNQSLVSAAVYRLISRDSTSVHILTVALANRIICIALLKVWRFKIQDVYCQKRDVYYKYMHCNIIR